jgi:ABC-type spermidine/putrescine transport systems, ATPase components
MAEEKDIIIRLDHISKSFGDKKVLDDISFYVKRGEFMTFLGPSGCGKTTMLRLIAGFGKPDEGTVTMEGKVINDVPPYQRKLNTVFQRYALFPHLDVYDNVAFGLKLQKVPEAEIEKRVKKVLKLVSMSDYEDRDVESLSGGQQQRVAIARALVTEPSLLLADEPTGNLDSHTSREIMEILHDLHEQGNTVVLITHDNDIARQAKRSLHILDGQVTEVQL